MAGEGAPDATTLRDDLVRGLDQATSLVAAVTPAELDLPTPCEGWTVRRLVRHMVGGMRSFTAVAEGGTMASFDVEVGDADLSASFRDGATELVAAWRAEGALEQRLTLFGREVPAAMPLNLQVTEVAIHGWDLATALGRADSLDPSVAETALAFAEANMGPEQRGQSFAPAREAPSGAGPYERLAAFTGREVAG